MIRGLIELLLGVGGRALLFLYNYYSYPINAAVVVYALFLIYLHNNLRRTVMRMEAMMLKIAEQSGQRPDPSKVYQQFLRSWIQTYGQESFLLPSRRDIWYSRQLGSDLIKVLHIQPEYVRMALHKQLGIPTAQEFSPFVYSAWQQYRHRLLLGLRGTPRDPKEIQTEYEKRNAKRR